MSAGDREPTQENVLNAFAVEPSYDRATLEKYLKAYPQYAGVLVDLSRELARSATSDDSSLTTSEHDLIEAAWRNHVASEAQSIADPLSALSVAQARDVAITLKVPRQVITALKERRVLAATIPKAFLHRFAEAAQLTVDQLAQSLALSPGSEVARSYKSDGKPSVGAQVSFERLLRDAGVSDAQRAALMRDVP